MTCFPSSHDLQWSPLYSNLFKLFSIIHVRLFRKYSRSRFILIGTLPTNKAHMTAFPYKRTRKWHIHSSRLYSPKPWCWSKPSTWAQKNTANFAVSSVSWLSRCPNTVLCCNRNTKIYSTKYSRPCLIRIRYFWSGFPQKMQLFLRTQLFCAEWRSKSFWDLLLLCGAFEISQFQWQ